jgi:hypothetical protein
MVSSAEQTVSHFASSAEGHTSRWNALATLGAAFIVGFVSSVAVGIYIWGAKGLIVSHRRTL